MITDKYLIQNGYKKEKINDNIYFIKGEMRLEKCSCGYIVSKPYTIISTIFRLKQIEK